MKKASITNAVQSATNLLEESHVRRAPVTLEKIARHLGAKLKYSPLDEELSGMIYIKEGTPIIGVNALHHPNRQRFTIAHELGHLRLHHEEITKEVHVDKEFPMLRRDAVAATGVDAMEIEANAFAAELLMPESFVKALLEDKHFDIDDDEFITNLSTKFKVSTLAMQLRLGKILD